MADMLLQDYVQRSVEKALKAIQAGVTQGGGELVEGKIRIRLPLTKRGEFAEEAPTRRIEVEFEVKAAEVS